MKYFTFSINSQTIEKIKSFYSDKVFLNEKNPYIIFSVSDKDFKIDIYTTNKMVISGTNAEYESQIWKEYATLIKVTDSKDNNSKSELPFTFYDRSHFGSDEVGTGDFFGPICVVACYVKESDFTWLKNLGVTDSKKIRDEKIIQLAPIIGKRIIYSLLSLDNQKYNQLIKEGLNLNQIKAKMHNQALLNVTNKIPDNSSIIVIDQFTPEKNYYNYLENDKEVLKNVHFETKAESKYLAVAVASILARYSFLIKLDALAYQFGLELPKGAGAIVDQAAVYIVKHKGFDFLNNIAKMNFKNIEKINNLISQLTDL